MKKQHSFFKRNGLLLTFLAFMLLSLLGQIYTGWQEHHQERQEKGYPEYSIGTYLTSGHFVQATFENWESEFLSVAAIVFLSIYLRQYGSPESKAVDAPHSETGK